jgi:TRAP-type C4-dicarboxylate transport system permease small subunit
VFRRLEDGLVVVSFTALLGAALVQIVLRNGFATSLPGADELTRTLVLWLALGGALIATREGNHIRIDLLQKSLPAAWARSVERLSLGATAGLSAFAGYHGALLCWLEFEDGRAAFWGVPVWGTLLIVPLGFGAMALRFLLRLRSLKS